ncbi:hypothetical protein O181_017776 [Austropuccinia psidii MF-1]|uniref:Uncharacterized protein n=1 Tax=Austropuccinia psidii MF-1 TaxID=1389203 RepID=A0A9Q3GSA7_9BASI|nr:hypothetical protein [Austropuccinia psidii MF-1]
MASSENFDPFQTYDGYKEVELLDPPCSECLIKGKECFQNFNPRSSEFHHSFVGKKPCQCPGVPLLTIKRYLWSKKDGCFGKGFPVSEAHTPDSTSGCSSYSEGSNKSDGEEVEVINPLVGHPSRDSPTQPPARKFHSQLPSSAPPPSPKPSTSRPILASPMKPSPIPQPRPSHLHTSHQLKPVASTRQ